MIDKQREFLLHWQCLGVLKRLPMKRLNTVNKLGYFGVFWLLVFIMMGWVGAYSHPAKANSVPTLPCQVADPELQLAYQGECKNGQAHGWGIARGEHGALYQGQFAQGSATGYGVKLYANGDAYAGDWDQGYRHGYGVYEFGEQSPWRGDKYVGQWQRDQRHGEGTYYFHPNEDAFHAQWEQGEAKTPATPLLQRRKRAVEAISPVVGQVGQAVCSTLTNGAGPDRVAYGQVVAVHEDRIQVYVDSLDVLKYSSLALNPRWDVMTKWTLCKP